MSPPAFPRKSLYTVEAFISNAQVEYSKIAQIMTSLHTSSHASESEPKCLHQVFQMERKNPKEEANEKWITKIFYCQSTRRGGEASPVLSFWGWSNFRQRRTVLEAATAAISTRWPRDFAGVINCVKASVWYCSMNQKPIASCEFLLWESQQTFSSSVYGCEFTASIALHNFGFSFDSFLRSPKRNFLFGRKRTVTRMVSVTTLPLLGRRDSVPTGYWTLTMAFRDFMFATLW